MTHQPIPDGPEPAYERVVSGYQTFRSDRPFPCEWGGVLPELAIAYETWGKLSDARDNAVLLHTGLSASSHAPITLPCRSTVVIMSSTRSGAHCPSPTTLVHVQNGPLQLSLTRLSLLLPGVMAHLATAPEPAPHSGNVSTLK